MDGRSSDRWRATQDLSDKTSDPLEIMKTDGICRLSVIPLGEGDPALDHLVLYIGFDIYTYHSRSTYEHNIAPRFGKPGKSTCRTGDGRLID